MKVKANYCDGITANFKVLEVSIGPSGLTLPSGEVWVYEKLKLIASSKLDGSVTYNNKDYDGPNLTLVFDKGIDDPARDYLKRFSSHLTGDSNWHFVRWQIVTTAVILCLMFCFYLGYPYLNRAIVSVIPNSWAIKAGNLVVDGLYNEYSSNACHSADGDYALEKLVETLEIEGLSYPLRVEVVDHQQVNALTAAGGRVVIFNGLITKATSADEVAGVLAHETGHVYYQHPLQGLINVLGFSIVGSFLGGDAASVAVVGLSLSYSRDLERMADEKALEILQDKKISAQGILDFFERTDKKEKNEIVAELEDIFSTHPLSKERINIFSKHIAENEIKGTSISALSAEEWESLQNICNESNE